MSIFKETFKDFVFKQLRIREAIVEQGNAIKDPTNFSSRFGSPRTKIKGENITIDKGAFYTNSVSKQCVIRMSSGVDITDSDLLEAGNSSEKTGSDLAKRYILEGGVLGEDKKPRGKDFNNFAKKGGAYGDPFIRSDAKDGFGIVPMPGIVDANIRTKSAYGSLREAKVNFICHNRRQLDVLEMLYMRPGFPVLLEWQWSPFINNDGKIDNTLYGIKDDWWDKNKTINNLNTTIRQEKARSGGNYDGFVGFCKNFEIKARPDGGYDCTTELIAAGEVLEGLKARRNSERITVEDKYIEVDSLEFLLEAFLELGEYSGGGGSGIVSLTNEWYGEQGVLSSDAGYQRRMKQWDKKTADAKVLNQFLKNLNDHEFTKKAYLKSKREKIKDAKPAKSIINDDGDTVVDLEELGSSMIVLRNESTFKVGNDYFKETQGTLAEFFLFKGEQIFDNKYGTKEEKNIDQINNKPFSSRDTFVRWDFLCSMFNTFVFPEIKEDARDREPLIKLVYRQDIVPDPEISEEYLNFTPYKIPNSLSKKERALYNKITNDDSFKNNPIRGALLGTWSGLDNATVHDVVVEDLMNVSYDPQICLLPIQVPNTKKYNRKDVFNINSIGLIFLNVNHLKKTYKDMAYNGDRKNNDFNLFDYMSKIWEDVNVACCGRFNFTLQTELENPNHVRVIDLQTNEDHLKTIERKDLFEFKVQSNKSVVRDFNYNTTIPGPLSATIAIAAQAPSSVSDLDQVTFANFSKGIKSRFTISKDSSDVSEDEQEKYNDEQKKIYKELYENYKANVIQLAYFKQSIERGNYSSEGGTIDKTSFSMVVSLSKSIEGQLNSLLKRNPTTGIPRPSIPQSRSAVIPLKFNAKMDGVGGIVIGNIFIVEKEKLPKGYQGEDVAFVVLGESQNITSGQDWTTEISGQLMLLDSLEKKDNDNLPPGTIGGESIGSGGATSATEPIETNDIIDNGPPVDDVILPVDENVNPYDPADVYNWEEWEKNNNPSAQFNNCPAGQVWDENLQACVLEDISIEPKVGNTGLTQEQINNGKLETTKRRVNGKTPYEYAYLLQAAGSAQNGALQEEFFKGNSSNVNILISKCDKLRQQYSSVFQYNFSMQDFPSLRNANVGSAFSSYESWITYLSKTFPNLV